MSILKASTVALLAMFAVSSAVVVAQAQDGGAPKKSAKAKSKCGGEYKYYDKKAKKCADSRDKRG